MRKTNKTDSSDDDEFVESEDNEICLICLVPLSQSADKNWIQCTACKRWTHVACGSDDDFYVCIHCASDDEN